MGPAHHGLCRKSEIDLRLLSGVGVPHAGRAPPAQSPVRARRGAAQRRRLILNAVNSATDSIGVPSVARLRRQHLLRVGRRTP